MMIRRYGYLFASGLIGALMSPGAPALAAAGCPDGTQAIADEIVMAWQHREAMSAPAIADGDHAICVQNAVVAGLVDDGQQPSGWKVGLTSAAAQENFGVDHPLAGRLLPGSILEDGATVSRGFGGRPVVEADLIVTVADPAIMEATTPLEVLAHLDSFVPFIELPDLMVAAGEPMSADVITAINVGARTGVAGPEISLSATEETVDALGAMTVRIEDAGKVVAEIPGAAILGNPLNAMLWLTGELAARGLSLQAGDRISLGSFGPPMQPVDLERLTVTYIGLPFDTDPAVTVAFE
ncbi:hypothetical protein [Fodinicurvata sp. EGI_FJ10296]|uniref:2-keto-4-pentenoate hydratase n=1 Tax=Fodinicurvata sp. EGI_FJ10296 TaxID=3231908 RepID=UPI0034544258